MTSTLNLEGEQVRVRLENGAMMRGDCNDYLASLKQRVDLVVTDPPLFG